MSSVLVILNARPTVATKQECRVDGTGVDLNMTVEVRSYRRGNRNWKWGWGLGDRTADTLGESRGEGLYVEGLYDGANVLFGEIYTRASDDHIAEKAQVGHLRKIDGRWKFRSGHDCNQYLHGNVRDCGRCGMRPLWKD
jgi:hypothetical protein